MGIILFANSVDHTVVVIKLATLLSVNETLTTTLTLKNGENLSSTSPILQGDVLNKRGCNSNEREFCDLWKN